MRGKLLLLLTTLAFVASFFVVPTAHAKRGDAAIGAARLAMVHAANAVKPSPKAERTPGPAVTPRVFGVEPAAFVLVSAKTPPKQYVPNAPDQSDLMVFLN